MEQASAQSAFINPQILLSIFLLYDQVTDMGRESKFLLTMHDYHGTVYTRQVFAVPLIVSLNQDPPLCTPKSPTSSYT